VREIEVNGKKFGVRGLRLSEIGKDKMKKLGYGRFIFAANMNPQPDGEDPPDQQDRMGEIMDAALVAVFGKETVDDIDKAGGVGGLRTAWQAIIAETYGDRDEEKNSPPAGSGKSTPSGLPTAPDAGN
jgi:hypothetical protein